MAKLTAKECRKFIDAVVEKAAAMGAPVSIAVVGPEAGQGWLGTSAGKRYDRRRGEGACQ